MAWFKRKDAGIKTSTEEKKDTPDGLWYKTPKGNIIHTRELKNNSYVCPDDDYHVKIGSNSQNQSEGCCQNGRRQVKRFGHRDHLYGF